MPVKKLNVDGQEVLIACTVDEAKDKSYMDYLAEGTIYKTREQARNKPEKPRRTYSKEHVGGALKEFNDWKKRSENGFKRKYF